MFWFDGKLNESGIAPVDLTDRGLTLGDGLFDTSLARNGRTFLREAHLARFAASAEALSIPYNAAQAAQALDALADAIGNGIVRLTLTRGAGARGLVLPEKPRPFLFGAAVPNSADAFFPSLRLATSTIRRNETSPASHLKALPYLDAILALEAAKEKGADDVLFENTAGRIACLSVANVFAVFGRDLVTPPFSDGVLPGTIRALILSEAKSLGFTAKERSLTTSDLLRADAVFATNSVRLVAPCTSLDGQSLSGSDHKAVKAVQTMLLRAIEGECGA